MQPPARILIADDHALSSDGLRRLLEAAGFVVLPPVPDGLAALALARAEHPDLAILDYDMPGATGLEVMAELRRWAPETRVVILTGRPSPALLASVREAGADGLLKKTSAPDALETDIRQILAGTRVFPDDEPEAPQTLSRRELQTLEAIADGLSNPAIAEKLNISVKTVESHRASVMRKLGVHSTASLIIQAVRRGLLAP